MNRCGFLLLAVDGRTFVTRPSVRGILDRRGATVIRAFAITLGDRSMSSFLKKLFRGGQAPRPPETSEEATRLFLALFQAHGLEVSLVDGWIVAESVGLLAQARVFPHSPRPGIFSAQLDFEVRSPSLAGRSLLESSGGFGDSVGAAVGDSIRNFRDGSFHVIFSALTGRACSHGEVEDWVVDGRPRKVFLGPIVGRGPGTPPIDWFAAISPEIERMALPPGLHWLRLYHAQFPGGEPTNEALLDNEDCPGLRSWLGDWGWPPAEGFSSVRLFLMISDG